MAMRAVAGLATASPILPFLALEAGVAAAQTGPMQEVVVKLASPSVHASSVLSGLPGTTPLAAAGDRWIFQVHASQAPAVISKLDGDSGQVDYAEVAEKVHSDSVTPNDPCYSGCGPTSPTVENPDGDAGPSPTVFANQAYLQTVNAPQAWSITTGSSSVVVGVLDTGVDSNNPDLVGKVISGPNVCARDDALCGSAANVADGNGHGSHTSGIVAANTNNGIGVASIGWNTTVEMIKVLDSEGGGTTADVATGIYDAVAAGVKVISMSFSNDPCDEDPLDCGPDPDEQAAVNYA
ncbi:MAG: S8 family serine peptidase, partial [Acidimicrobiales bacterium]